MSKARKPYNGHGVTVPAVTPVSLPPEPNEQNLTVQVFCLHAVFGALPIFDRMLTRYMPHGWISDPFSWRDLVRLGSGRAPTILDSREVTP